MKRRDFLKVCGAAATLPFLPASEADGSESSPTATIPLLATLPWEKATGGTWTWQQRMVLKLWMGIPLDRTQHLLMIRDSEGMFHSIVTTEVDYLRRLYQQGRSSTPKQIAVGKGPTAMFLSTGRRTGKTEMAAYVAAAAAENQSPDTRVLQFGLNVWLARHLHQMSVSHLTKPHERRLLDLTVVEGSVRLESHVFNWQGRMTHPCPVGVLDEAAFGTGMETLMGRAGPWAKGADGSLCPYRMQRIFMPSTPKKGSHFNKLYKRAMAGRLPGAIALSIPSWEMGPHVRLHWVRDTLLMGVDPTELNAKVL